MTNAKHTEKPAPAKEPEVAAAAKPTQAERIDAVEERLAHIEAALATGDPTHAAMKFAHAK